MLSDKIKESQKSEFQSKGAYFKFKEGVNKIRVLTEPEMYFEDFQKGVCYTGCGFTGSARGLAYVIDLMDGNQIKLMRIPYGITEYLASLETNEDYKFDSYPMPYDITIDAKGAGTKEVVYTPTPRPTRKTVSDEVINEVMGKKTCAEMIVAWKAKNKEENEAQGTSAVASVAENESLDNMAASAVPTDL